MSTRRRPRTSTSEVNRGAERRREPLPSPHGDELHDQLLNLNDRTAVDAYIRALPRPDELPRRLDDLDLGELLNTNEPWRVAQYLRCFPPQTRDGGRILHAIFNARDPLAALALLRRTSVNRSLCDFPFVATLIDSPDAHGFVLMHKADSAAEVHTLLNAGASVDAPDWFGHSALAHVHGPRAGEVACALLANGADGGYGDYTLRADVLRAVATHLGMPDASAVKVALQAFMFPGSPPPAWIDVALHVIDVHRTRWPLGEQQGHLWLCALRMHRPGPYGVPPPYAFLHAPRPPAPRPYAAAGPWRSSDADGRIGATPRNMLRAAHIDTELRSRPMHSSLATAVASDDDDEIIRPIRMRRRRREVLPDDDDDDGH